MATSQLNNSRLESRTLHAGSILETLALFMDTCRIKDIRAKEAAQHRDTNHRLMKKQTTHALTEKKNREIKHYPQVAVQPVKPTETKSKMNKITPYPNATSHHPPPRASPSKYLGSHYPATVSSSSPPCRPAEQYSIAQIHPLAPAADPTLKSC